MASLLVIGLDGATLDLIGPWAAEGRLPVLAGLLARGAWGRLRSTVPAATFPAWTSLVTGVNPGRHGVLDFTERVPGTYRVRFVNGSHRRVPALWNRLSAAGRRVAVLTVPATYPPEAVNGVMVSGFDSPLATAIDGSFVHPRALYRDIQRLIGRVPFADFQELATGPGWHETARARLMDGVAHVNRRLAECGLLGFRGRRAGRLGRLARAAALRAVPARLQGPLLRRAPATAGRLEGMHRFAGIDWPRTRAYSEELDYHPSVWLNLRGRDPEGTVEPAAYEETRERVAAALASWRHGDGRPVIARIWRREEVYDGPFVARAPDLLLELTTIDGYSTSCLRSDGQGPALRRLASAEHGGGKGRGMNGTHRPDGLFVLAGEGVRPAGELPAAEIVDVLPTLLALAGLPVPRGLDGRPITGALPAPPRFVADPVDGPGAAAVPYSAGEARDVARRLAALGYF
ncbi:MAG TPA: alkaline phosphatase family protein, partial [Candidatus Binatus sp.]|nr:alkaline phosphatase family protein [Candidatus Binatus sp.]